MESIDMKFEILNSAHLASLVKLYDQIFKKKVQSEYFTIKYGLEIENRKQLPIAAFEGDRMIGFFGGFVQRFTVQDKKVNIAYACDFFLEEEFRGKRIFDHIYNRFLENCREADIDFIYAFQSEQTYKFCKRQGWLDQPDLRRIQISLFPKPLKSVLERIFGSNWSLKVLSNKLKPFEIDLDAELLNNGEDGRMVYDLDFIKMKGFNRKYFIEIEGVKYWLKYDYRITIGWMSAPSEERLKRSLNILKSIARSSGIHEIIFHYVEGDQSFEELKKISSELPSFKMSYMPIGNPEISFQELQFSFIDGDLF